MSVPSTTALVATPRVILVCDLAGYHRAFEGRDDEEMAEVLEAYYALVGGSVEGASGEVVKLIGDAVLAVFPPERSGDAVRVALALEREVGVLAAGRGVPLALGAQLHRGTVLEGEVGYGPHRRRDVIGRVVNETFLLRGSGVRVSEELRSSLPDELREALGPSLSPTRRPA